MKTWWPRIAVLALLVLILSAPLLLRPLAQKSVADTDTPHLPDASARLVIYTPHNEQIRYEYARAFNRYRASKNLPGVEFDWRASGGTTDLRKTVLDQFQRKADLRQEDQGIGVDLFFGGGDYDHNLLARGVPVTRDGKPATISATLPVDISKEDLESAFPTPDIGGEPLYHPQLFWVGSALSSFGIVYNRDVLAIRGLPEPRTWEDLQDGRYFRWVALADPSHSGSIVTTYNAILRRLGWTEGWATLRRSFANARYFTASAGRVPVDVSAGEAAAGMCIDFYGRFQAGAVASHGEGASPGQPSRLGYVDPPFMTAITADPISILRGAPHRQIANEFVLWVLSPPGQELWQRRTGLPRGEAPYVIGPVKFELRRLPVRRDLYTPAHLADWADPVDPFAIAKPVTPGMPDFRPAITPLTLAMAIDIHDDLRDAWGAILREPPGPRRTQMLTRFDAMPEDLDLTRHWPDPDLAANWRSYLEDASHPRNAQVAAILKSFTATLFTRWQDPDTLLRDRLRWTRYFKETYRAIADE